MYTPAKVADGVGLVQFKRDRRDAEAVVAVRPVTFGGAEPCSVVAVTCAPLDATPEAVEVNTV